MTFKRGMHGYASLLRSIILEPATTSELSTRFETCRASISLVMRRLHAQDIVHVQGWVEGDAAYKMPAERWAYGEGLDMPPPALKSGGVRQRIVSARRVPMKVEAYTFGLIVKALEEGHSIRSLCELLGLHRRGTDHLTAHMKSIRLVHISGWDASGAGCPGAIYRIGDKRNVPRPKPQSLSEYNRRYRQKRAQRASFPDIHRIFAQQCAA